MSVESKTAKSWTCNGCGVSAGRIDGKAVPLPSAWSHSAEGLFCLVCRRERAAEAALLAAPSDSPVDARAKLRRAALIEFEASRTPDQTDGTIAPRAAGPASGQRGCTGQAQQRCQQVAEAPELRKSYSRTTGEMKASRASRSRRCPPVR